jgi:16S rRNA (adenine1518-N6/adenine1519-N6)-dimethyltransferase
VRKSIELAELGADSCVVEIGPGLGTLTKAILNSGASLWAVERDACLAKHLRIHFSDELNGISTMNERRLTKQTILQLIEGDCLDHPRAGLPAATAATGYRIVANLPYAVSTPWMDAVIAGELPERMVLMLQKEAADRYVAPHGTKTFGAISIFLQSVFEVHSKHLVSAQCFHPAPKVDSVLLRLDRRTDAIRFSLAARECIRRIFTQRRKQLGALCKNDSQAGALVWFNELLEHGVTPTVRPEELAIEHWQSITRFIH